MKLTYLIFVFAVLGSKIKDIELNEEEEPTDYYLTQTSIDTENNNSTIAIMNQTASDLANL